MNITPNIDMTKVNDVVLTMEDMFTGKEVIRRIDKLNAFKSGSVCWELGSESSQRQSLESWIEERGNEQHETILELKHWRFA